MSVRIFTSSAISPLTSEPDVSSSASIAAASVLAKVTRDDYMEAMAVEYPGYGFEVHKGYGTKAHYKALTELGPSRIHRMTFLRKFYGEA